MAPQLSSSSPVALEGPHNKGRLLSVAAAAAGCYFAAARVAAFVAAGSPNLRSSSGHLVAQPEPAAAPRVAASIESAAAPSSQGVWLFAGATAMIGTAARRRHLNTAAKAEKQEVQEKAVEPSEAKAAEEKAPFDVLKPDTYGNITMDDVKKYGVAGTLSYVITELVFWAIAFPTECIVYLNTAGHWPDFSKPEESAAVFGLVFAASNIARLLLPLRFGAALAMAPWVDENIVKRFGGEKTAEGA